MIILCNCLSKSFERDIKTMMYLMSEMFLYLLCALVVGFVMGWLLRGLQLSRYTRSLQQELDRQKTGQN